MAAPLVLVGCGGDSITGSSPSQAGSALVRVAHLSPDAPAVDVLVNGARVVTGAVFGDATGDLALPAGSARIQVVPRMLPWQLQNQQSMTIIMAVC